MESRDAARITRVSVEVRRRVIPVKHAVIEIAEAGSTETTSCR
jgi:hypothetical protein